MKFSQVLYIVLPWVLRQLVDCVRTRDSPSKTETAPVPIDNPKPLKTRPWRQVCESEQARAKNYEPILTSLADEGLLLDLDRVNTTIKGNTCKAPPQLPRGQDPGLLPAIADSTEEDWKNDDELIGRFEQAVERLKILLQVRGTMCDDTNPCRVHVKPPWEVEVCIPHKKEWSGVLCQGLSNLDERKPHVLHSSDVPTCQTFDIKKLATWQNKLHSIAPFLQHSTIQPLDTEEGDEKLYHWDKDRGTLHVNMERPGMDKFVQWLKTRILDKQPKPQSLDRCAVVFGGHTLRCGGHWGPVLESDTYAAVFRANSGQQVGNERTNIDECLAGRRTDFRTNCLHDSVYTVPGENCIVPFMWFSKLKLMQGNESSEDRIDSSYTCNNQEMSCCAPAFRSLYSMETVNEAVATGAQFSWIVEGLENPFADIVGLGTGEQTLQAALSLCKTVDLFGSGVFSEGPGSDMNYNHFYDPVFSTCDHELDTIDNVMTVKLTLKEILLPMYDAFGLLNSIWW